MEANAGAETLILQCVGGPSDATSDHVERWILTQATADVQIEARLAPIEFTAGLAALSEGETDLLAVSARDWFAAGEPNDGRVAAVLPRREENHILVADDRPSHLPYKSIILVPGRLQRRQMRRYRPDFRIMSPTAFAEVIGAGELPDDPLDLTTFMEALRLEKTITGYVTERHLFKAADPDARRHALMTDPRKGDAMRFLPSPLQGLTLLISRHGFPRSIAERIGDAEGMTAWTCERILLGGLDPALRDRAGMIVRHRQIASLLSQAEEEKDLLRSTSLLDGEGDVIDPTPMVEILLETLDRRGGRTLLLERLCGKEDVSTSTRLLLNEWRTMLAAVTSPHEEDIRLGPARPAFLEL